MLLTSFSLNVHVSAFHMVVLMLVVTTSICA